MFYNEQAVAVLDSNGPPSPGLVTAGKNVDGLGLNRWKMMKIEISDSYG